MMKKRGTAAEHKRSVAEVQAKAVCWMWGGVLVSTGLNCKRLCAVQCKTFRVACLSGCWFRF